MNLNASMDLVGRVCPSAPVGHPEGPAARWGQTRPALRARAEAAFTMVEVALSLAIVAFAMVAIIGVMPAGLNVQKENREDTIISQDAAFLLEAIRGGEASSNLTALSAGLVGNIYGVNTTTYPPSGTPSFPYSPLDIVKRLSIPAWHTGNFTNGTLPGVVGARFRAMSGGLGDTAGAATNAAFNYYVQVQITRFNPDPYSPAYNALATNLHEIKLAFQWPVYDDPASTVPPVNFGNRSLVVRSLVSGQLVKLDDVTNGGYFFRTAILNGQ